MSRTLEEARDAVTRARMFGREPAPWAVKMLEAAVPTDTGAAFRRVGLCEEDARIAARGLAEGRYSTFAEAVASRQMWDAQRRNHVQPHLVREVSESMRTERRPATGASRLVERAAPSSVRPLLVERAATARKGEGLYEARLISTGQGSSGYYPAATLEEAARAGVFACGTQCYLDHPTESDAWQRPERSVRDLAGALASPAVFREGALYADVRVFAPHRGLIAEMAPYIGMSIRADGIRENRSEGGFTRPTVTKIDRVLSVDFVTSAGRGGRLMV